MTKILFLEDESTIREVLTEYMKLQQYEVTAVSDGQQALDLAACEIFDLAVLDIMVPKISGLEVLAYLQKHRPGTAVIMLSAIEEEQTQAKAFDLYADDYVIKPVSPLILLKRMETILRRTRRSISTAQPNGLAIDEQAYRAYFDGQPLPLTLSEFLLLQELMQAPNRVYTREQLILRIFNEDYIGNDRIIDAHIKNLRKKLPQNYIKTVIGVGYQFCRE